MHLTSLSAVSRIPPTGGYGDRAVGAAYAAAPATPAAYSSPALNTSATMPTTPTAYGAGPTTYSTPTAGYGATATGVYGDTRAAPAATGYGAVPAAGGYGDGYTAAARSTTGYDTAYPPLPQQRGGYVSFVFTFINCEREMLTYDLRYCSECYFKAELCFTNHALQMKQRCSFCYFETKAKVKNKYIYI